MKQPTVRPARAAIAAVLAFASTPVLAQVADPSAPPPVTVTQTAPAPVVAAPVVAASLAPTAAGPAPVMAAPSPVVQPTPAPAPVAAAPEAAPEAAPAPRTAPVRAVERSAPRAEAVNQRDAAPAPAETSASPAAATPLAEPQAPTATQEVAPVPATPTPAEPANVDSGNGLEWGLVGGAIVLLGGLGLMATRRRRNPDRADELLLDRGAEPVRSEPVADRLYTPAPAIAVETTYDKPSLISPRPAAASARTIGADHSLDAMAAATPSAENPFLTRKNRLRRAHFMQRQQDVGQHGEIATAHSASSVQEQRRPSPVYDFGGGMTQRRGFGRPATT